MGQSVSNISNLVSDSHNTGREPCMQSPPIPDPGLVSVLSDPDRPADERTLDIQEKLPLLDIKEVSEPVLRQEDEKAGNWDLKKADEVVEGEKENGPSNWEEEMGGGSEWNGWDECINPQVPWIVTDDNWNENETVIEDRAKGERNGGAFTESHQYRSPKNGASKFNPSVRRKNKAITEKVKEKEEVMAIPSQTECKSDLIARVYKDGRACRPKHKKGEASGSAVLEPNLPMRHAVIEKMKEQGKSTERPGQTECKSFMTSGVCKYGKACRYKHTKGKASGTTVLEPDSLDLPMRPEKVKEWGESTERPGQTECKNYLTSGVCKYGRNCRHKHTRGEASGTTVREPNLPKRPVVKEKEKVKEMGKSTERPGQTECKVVKEKEKVKEMGESTERPGQTECKVVKEKEKVKEMGESTERPGQTGCKVVKEKEKVKEMGESTERPGQTECKVVKEKEKVKEMGESTERPGQTECKSYLTSGLCKNVRTSRHKHTKGKASGTKVLEFNFLDLPIRPGEKECPYYMSTGSCKYGVNCKFNHPDPSAVEGSDDPSGVGNGGSASSGASQSSMPSSSPPRKLNVTAPFVPLELSPLHSVPPQNPYGYQAPVYIPEMRMHPTLAEANVYMHHEHHVQVDEYPERPGQPECSRFIKTGACKFKLNCRYHHPKDRIMKSPQCALSDTGLPLRPDHNICEQYSRYGICKFGLACKFDHPVHSASGWE